MIVAITISLSKCNQFQLNCIASIHWRHNQSWLHCLLCIRSLIVYFIFFICIASALLYHYRCFCCRRCLCRRRCLYCRCCLKTMSLSPSLSLTPSLPLTPSLSSSSPSPSLLSTIVPLPSVLVLCRQFGYRSTIQFYWYLVVTHKTRQLCCYYNEIFHSVH